MCLYSRAQWLPTGRELDSVLEVGERERRERVEKGGSRRNLAALDQKDTIREIEHRASLDAYMHNVSFVLLLSRLE